MLKVFSSLLNKSRALGNSLPLRVRAQWLTLIFLAAFATGCSSIRMPWNQGVEMPVVSTAGMTEEAKIAEALYHEAWQTVLNDYMDPEFNGQDWKRWKDRYKGLLKTREDAYVAIDTMLASLNDEYTRFLPPREMNEQSMSIDSRLYGVGIQITAEGGKLMVVRTLEETPASRADIHPNDLITEIDGKSTTGFTVEQAADMIRGPKGTAVKLTLLRGNKELKLSVVRDEIKLKSVYTKALDKNPDIGYVRLTSFMSETAYDELHAAFEKMKNKKAIIFDLRGNYGGLLTNAIYISDMFLDSGTIVSVEGRWDIEDRVYSARMGQDIPRKPMVLLIDGGSASASEIVSGALKENHRAVLVGSKTFGKGLVQKISNLSGGAGMNITISRYLTPKGEDIHHKGISPDIKVDFTRQDLMSNRDPQLDAAVSYLAKSGYISARATSSSSN